MALGAHYNALCGFISNLAIMAATDKQSHDQSLYAMNTNKLFIFGLELHEQAQDSMKIFETREAITLFQTALAILKEILAEMRFSETLSQPSAAYEESK